MQSGASALDRWSWTLYHTSFGTINSIRKFIYWWKLNSGTPPSVFREIGIDSSNILDAVYPEGVPSQTMQEIQALIQICTINGGGLNRLAGKIKKSSKKWEMRQRRPRWKQYVLDISPITWISYIVRTRIFQEAAINPVVYPAVVLEQNEEIFDLLTTQLGRIFYYLDEMNNFLKRNERPSEEELQDFVREKYLKLLSMYHPEIGEMSENILSSHISSQVEDNDTLDLDYPNKDFEMNELRELVQERMGIYLLDLRKQVKQRKYQGSQWIKKLIGVIVVVGVSVKVQSYGYQNLIDKYREESGELIITAKRFYQSHIKEPLTRIYRTIRYDETTLGINTSKSNLEAERNALEKMVIEYMKKVHPAKISSSAAYREVCKQASEGNLAMVIDDYASAVKSPIYQALFGELLQLVLIQVHKLKVDAEKGVAVMDQLMRANELNFQLLTLVPAVLVVGGLGTWIYKIMYPGIDPKVLAEIRHQFREVGIIINGYNSPEKSSGASKQGMSWKDIGHLVYCINAVQELADGLPSTERKYLIMDSQELLNSEFNISQKLVTVERIYHNL